MPRFESVALIVNARARRARGCWAAARRGLAARGIACEAHLVRDPRKLSLAVAEAVAGKPDLLILGGGDGSVSSVVDLLVGEDVPLALLPLGTANSFARSLGIPLDPAAALDLVTTGRLGRVDLGRIDGDHFANCAALGMAARIAGSIPHGLKRWGGRLGYALWAAVALIGFCPFRVTVGDVALDVVELRIANGSYQGGAEISPEASPDSGELLVQLVTGTRRAALVRHWLASLLRLPVAHRGMREIRARALRIEADPPQPISIDGEVVARTPVTAGIAPGAIRMLLPPVG